MFSSTHRTTLPSSTFAIKTTKYKNYYHSYFPRLFTVPNFPVRSKMSIVEFDEQPSW